MKNLFKIITIAGMSMFLYFSCIDDLRFGDKALDKLPGTDMNIDSVFNKAELARRYLWSTYHFMYYAFPRTSRADCNQGMQGNTWEPLSDCWHSFLGWDWLCEVWYPATFEPTAGAEYRARMSFHRSLVWHGVRAGWTFIENVDRVPDMTDAEKGRLKAEARIIIASRYFDLFRQYGGLPIVDCVHKASDDVHKERGTIQETVDFMIKQLDEAIAEPNLPWAIPDNELSTWFGRLTKGAAMGLKAKVLLYAASPLFNNSEPCYKPKPNENQKLPESITKLHVWYGDFQQSRWEDVKKACEDFFNENAKNGNYYALIQPDSRDEAGYRKAFRKAYFTRANSEKIMSTIKHYVQTEWDQGLTTPVHMGAMCPTAEYMEMFPMADGTPFDTTGVYIHQRTNTDGNTYTPPVPNPNPGNVYIFDGRDPRLYETLLVQKRGEPWRKGVPIELWPGGNYWGWAGGFDILYLKNGMGLYKWVLDIDEYGGALNQEPVQYPYLRMAEMYLIYAEALAQTGDLQKACDQLYLIRSRVGLGRIEVNNPKLNLTSNKDNLINEILRERACELGMEITRFYDLLRWKRKDLFMKQLHGIWTFRKDGLKEKDANPYPELYYERRKITEYVRKWWTNPEEWSDKWYLCPISIDEINKEWGMTQNPGW